MTRRGRIVVSKRMLEMLLDLPSHLAIVNVYETVEDSNRDAVSVIVKGRFCPEVPEGAVAPEITPVYKDLENSPVKLIGINGLDT